MFLSLPASHAWRADEELYQLLYLAVLREDHTVIPTLAELVDPKGLRQQQVTDMLRLDAANLSRTIDTAQWIPCASIEVLEDVLMPAWTTTIQAMKKPDTERKYNLAQQIALHPHAARLSTPAKLQLFRWAVRPKAQQIPTPVLDLALTAPPAGGGSTELIMEAVQHTIREQHESSQALAQMLAYEQVRQLPRDKVQQLMDLALQLGNETAVTVLLRKLKRAQF
jgi:hypothetical protein